MFIRCVIWMAFETEFETCMNINIFEKICDEPVKILWTEKCGSSSSQMQLAHKRSFTENLFIMIPLFQQRLDIRNLHRVIFGNARCAGAVRTQAFAKRKVNVQADAMVIVGFFKHLLYCTDPAFI